MGIFLNWLIEIFIFLPINKENANCIKVMQRGNRLIPFTNVPVDREHRVGKKTQIDLRWIVFLQQLWRLFIFFPAEKPYKFKTQPKIDIDSWYFQHSESMSIFGFFTGKKWKTVITVGKRGLCANSFGFFYQLHVLYRLTR